MSKIVVDWTRREQQAIAGALADHDKPIWMDGAVYALVPGNGGLHRERAAEAYRVLTEIDEDALRPDLADAFGAAIVEMERAFDEQNVDY